MWPGRSTASRPRGSAAPSPGTPGTRRRRACSSSFRPPRPSPAGGETGHVTVNQGVAEGLNGTLTQLLDPVNGSVAGAETSLNSQISDTQNQISQIQTDISTYKDYLTQMFSDMETRVSALQAQGNAFAASTRQHDDFQQHEHQQQTGLKPRKNSVKQTQVPTFMSLPNPLRTVPAPIRSRRRRRPGWSSCSTTAQFRFLSQALPAMRGQKYDQQSLHIGKAQAILAHLRDTLDFGAGGAVARHLSTASTSASLTPSPTPTSMTGRSGWSR